MLLPGKITDSSGGTASTTIPATAAYQTFLFPVVLSRLANSQVYAIDPGFAGTVVAINFRVGDQAASTSAKAATVQAQANGSSCTGGAVSLTTTACNAIGNQVAGSAITAGNTFTAAQSVGFTISGVTAFVEGDGVVELTVRNDDLNNFLAQAAASLNKVTDALKSLA